jgi:hypothetical protein
MCCSVSRRQTLNPGLDCPPCLEAIVGQGTWARIRNLRSRPNSRCILDLTETNSLVHQVLDIEHWMQVFPLDSLRRQAREFVLQRRDEQPDAYPTEGAVHDHIELMSPGGEMVTGPGDIAVLEQIRLEVPQLNDQSGLPLDVFIFGLGDGPSRAGTRVGGTPYRPRAEEWPKDRRGNPLVFVAQLCFADSRDLFTDQLAQRLPGDVLLLFLPDQYWEEDDLPFHAEWYPLGLDDLLQPEDVPESAFSIRPCYAVRHRTVDYPSALDLFERFDQPWRVALIEGTKIGSKPWWIQGEEEMPGDYLFTLGSLGVAPSRPWPWLNVEQPIPDWASLPQDLMQWGDMGSVYFSLDPEGALHWINQGY